MGLLVSCAKSCHDSFEGVRVVQLNGVVEEFDKPVKVKDLTDQHPRHFVCSSRSLRAINTRPFPAEEKLQPGELYFLLPFSVLDGDLSPVNLVSLASRLISGARKANAVKLSTPHGGKVTDSAISSFLSTERQNTMLTIARLPVSAGGYPAECQKLVLGNGGTGDCRELQTAYREHVLSRSKAWRPRLHTIDESCLAY